MKRWWMRSVIVLLGLGCHAQKSALDPLESALRNAPVGVEVTAETLGEDRAARPLSAGASLPSGAQLALLVTVKAPAYVYLGAASSDGTAEVLYPTAGEVRVQPGERLRIPPQGQWLTLDKHRGEEDYFVYAARRPLSRAEQEQRLAQDQEAARQRPLSPPLGGATKSGPRRPVKEVKHGARPDQDGARPAAPAAPLGPDEEFRGSNVTADKALTVISDPDGVQRVRFAIWHR